MQIDIESIIQRVLGGEVDAYAEIVRCYQNDLFRIAAYMLRDTAASEDLVQQAFVNAYRNLDKFQSGRDFGAWLRTIARNLVRNELRRSGREAKRLRHYYQWLTQHLERSEEADRNDQILREDLANCRQKLSESESQALDMRYEQALGFEQIATALNRTVAATRQMLSRIRIALRQCISERRSQS